MGTLNAPDIVVPIIDNSDGTLESGLSAVKIVPVGGTLQNDAITLPELASTGRYGKSTADGVDAVTQGVYLVYADSGSGDKLRGIYIHGGDFVDTHIQSTSNPHGVTAAQVTVTDSGTYFTGSNVETILQEIGSAIANIASPGTTLLTNSSTQSVASGKPKITNLDVDTVDGKHAANAADSIPVLDSNADLPLAQIPNTLTGKDADSVDGKEPGSGNNDLAILSDSQGAGKVDTTILGKKVGQVDDNIPQISTDATPDAGKVHDSLLGKKAGSGGGLDADTVDGKHATNAADSIPVLDSNADLPLAQIPDTLTGKDADTLDGEDLSGILRDKKRQDNTTNNAVTDQVVCKGWGHITGTGQNSFEKKDVLFPITFDSEPIIFISQLGGKTGSAPTSIGQFTDVFGVLTSAGTLTTFGFTAGLSRIHSVNFTNGVHYGFTWIAIGTYTGSY